MLTPEFVQDCIRFAKAYEDAQNSVDEDATISSTTNESTTTESTFSSLGLGINSRLKELREVFIRPITKVWNHDLGWKVVEVMDAHTVS
jgi:hypothetical protein